MACLSANMLYELPAINNTMDELAEKRDESMVFMSLMYGCKKY